MQATPYVRDTLRTERLEPRMMLAAQLIDHPTADLVEVTAPHLVHVTPQDAVLIINRLNQPFDYSPVYGGLAAIANQYLDVNGDGILTPLDLLLVINHLNSDLAQAEGEGEPHLPAALPQMQTAPLTAKFARNTSTPSYPSTDAHSHNPYSETPRHEPPTARHLVTSHRTLSRKLVTTKSEAFVSSRHPEPVLLEDPLDHCGR